MSFLSNKIEAQFFAACENIEGGELTVITPDGRTRVFGAGPICAQMQVNDWRFVTALAARGDIGLGESYVAGQWDTPSIEALISLAILNMDRLGDLARPSLFNTLKFKLIDRVLRANSLRGASQNIRAHYDVGNEFYQLWLDPTMTYSSGIFETEDEDLETAQRRKYARALSRLSDGDQVLEIGCGWGGFAEAAADQGRFVTGLTLSPSQKGYADARLDGRADIRLQDYRATKGVFDNIVSIEMIEAVGEKYWPVYFGAIKSHLAQKGRALIQAITVQDGDFLHYKNSSDYIRQYTFPGGMLLSDAVIRDQAQAAGLQVVDNFAFGQDYARTCRIWAQRLVAQRDAILALGYDQAFLRNWQYYLEICAAAFAVGRTNVVQVELAHG